MDDIYFSDIPSRKKKNLEDQNVDSFHLDTFSDETAQTPEQKKKFVVNLPDSETAAPPNRTPQGQPVSERTRISDGASRTSPYLSSAAPRSYTTASNTDKPVVSAKRSDTSAPKMPEYTPTPTVKRDISSYSQVTSRTPQGRPIQTQRPAARQPQQSGASARRQTAASGQARRRKRRRSHVGGKIVAVLLILVLLFGIAAVGYGYLAAGKLSYDKDFDRSNPYISSSELMQSASVKNILFIGSDARGDVEGQRSDTMLICSIDKAHHKVKLTSLLRDSYVYIPSKGYYTKLNAAFSYGGANLLVDTIEYNFKIKIDDYVMIDFEGFVKLIDSMGGLDVDDVTAAEAKYLRETVKILYAKEGKNHFSGAASLWYCRIRYLDNDFRRTERQRKVIGAIASQAMHTNPVKLMGIIGDIMPYITTSMTHSDVLPLGFSAVFNYLGGENPQHQIPADGTWSNARINGADVLKFDFDQNYALLKEFIYE